MKRLKRRIVASENVFDDSYSFKPTEVAELLSQIAELRGIDISLEKSDSGNLRFCIGDSIYEIVDSALPTV